MKPKEVNCTLAAMLLVSSMCVQAEMENTILEDWKLMQTLTGADFDTTYERLHFGKLDTIKDGPFKGDLSTSLTQYDGRHLIIRTPSHGGVITSAAVTYKPPKASIKEVLKPFIQVFGEPDIFRDVSVFLIDRNSFKACWGDCEVINKDIKGKGDNPNYLYINGGEQPYSDRMYVVLHKVGISNIAAIDDAVARLQSVPDKQHEVNNNVSDNERAQQSENTWRSAKIWEVNGIALGSSINDAAKTLKQQRILKGKDANSTALRYVENTTKIKNRTEATVVSSGITDNRIYSIVHEKTILEALDSAVIMDRFIEKYGQPTDLKPSLLLRNTYTACWGDCSVYMGHGVHASQTGRFLEVIVSSGTNTYIKVRLLDRDLSTSNELEKRNAESNEAAKTKEKSMNMDIGM